MKYILRRLAVSIPVIFGVTVIAYFAMTLAPGNAVDMLIDPGMTKADIELTKERLGLDQPVTVQYVRWLGELLQGNLGYSFRSRRPVAQLIGERMGATLLLTATALLLAYLVAIPIGVLSAIRQNSILDYAGTAFATIGISVPSFMLGLLLIYSFSLKLGWFPTGGMQTLGSDFGYLDRLSHLVQPAIVLSMYTMGMVMRYVRSSMLEVLHHDYMRTARAKGLSEITVLVRHGLRNAILPVITLLGLQLPMLFAGAIITEQIFGWPGMGRLVVQAITGRDYPVIMGLNLLAAVMVIAGNLFADIMYGVVDPRIRRQDS
jgi:peptide/nickel transport system permease protein